MRLFKAQGDDKSSKSNPNSPTSTSLPSLSSSPARLSDIESVEGSGKCALPDSLTSELAANSAMTHHCSAEGDRTLTNEIEVSNQSTSCDKEETEFTMLQDKKATSPVCVDESIVTAKEDNSDVLSKVNSDPDIGANFDIIPCRSGNDTGKSVECL